MHKSSSIAIVRTDRLGDMVLTLPMLAALRARHPTARIVLATTRYVQPLVEGLDVVDAVVYVDDAPNALSKGLRLYIVDTAYFPRPQFGEVWTALKSGVRYRIGSAYRWYSRLLFTTCVTDHRKHGEFHEAEYNVRMIASHEKTPQPTVHLVPPVVSPTSFALARGTVVVHPGSGGSSVDWPVDSMSELVGRLLALGIPVAITGSANEQDLCALIEAQNSSVVNLCARLTLADLIAVVSQASIVVANSTGVLHVAASTGTPVVGLYPRKPNLSARRWGPYASNAVVLESSGDVNMDSISVEAVVQAVCQLLLAT